MQALAEFQVMGQAAARIEIGDISAGDKRFLASAGEENNPCIVIALGLVKSIVECGESVHVESVKSRRPIDGEDRDLVPLFKQNALAHSIDPFSLLRKPP